MHDEAAMLLVVHQGYEAHDKAPSTSRACHLGDLQACHCYAGHVLRDNTCKPVMVSFVLIHFLKAARNVDLPKDFVQHLLLFCPSLHALPEASSVFMLIQGRHVQGIACLVDHAAKHKQA